MTSTATTASSTAQPTLPIGIDPAYYALSLLRRRKLDECVAVSTFYLHPDQRKKSTESNNESTAAQSESESQSVDTGIIDEQLWYIQTKAMVLQSWFDDTEIEDDGVDDVLLEGEQAVVSTAHRPNTSLTAAAARGGRAGGGSRAGGGGGLGTSSGARPVSSRYGFARPGTQSNRPGALQGRGGTAVRPITGRFIRLGTASLQAVPGGPHINLQRLNLEKYAQKKPMVAKLLCDYLLYVEHKPKMALQLCEAALKPPPPPPPVSVAASGDVMPPLVPPAGSGIRGSGPFPPMVPVAVGRTPQATEHQVQQVGVANAHDWWWKARLAKANYQLGLLREAEKHFKAALFEGSCGPSGSPVSAAAANRTSKERKQTFANYSTGVVMEMAKLYKKMDQPLTALELFATALEENCVDHHMLLCSARLYDDLHDSEKAFEMYKQVLRVDSSNVEAIACIAAHFFYEKNQPEISLRFYRRLLQMGVHSTEIWNNIGLCAFQSSQLDFALSCFERALALCKDDAQQADVWYNIGHIGIGLGNVKLAERGFRLAVAADPSHAEALNNLAVLALTNSKEDADGGEVIGLPSGVSTAASADEDNAQLLLSTAAIMAPELPEALYNLGLLEFMAGNFEESNRYTSRALDAFPEHSESNLLRSKLKEYFKAL